MARPKKNDGLVTVEALRDGVFVAEDVRLDKGQTAEAPADIAEVMAERGHVRIH